MARRDLARHGETYVHPDEDAAAEAIERLGGALTWGESGANRSRT
jgi:hypothetical protein